MYIKKELYILFVFCLSILVSCTDKTQEETETSRLDISINELPVMDSKGETTTFRITSTTPWEITEVQDWCTVAPVMGLAGTTEVTVTCNENKSYDERNSSFVISSGAHRKSLLVTQKQKDALLLSSNKVEIDSDGGKSVIEVKTNLSLKYEIDNSCADWLRINNNSSRGLTDETIILEIDKNANKNKRVGKIYVKSETLEEVIIVYQEGFNPSIVLSQNKYTLNSNEHSIKIEIKSNINYEMHLPSHIDWIHKTDARSVSSYTHYLNVLPNDTYDTREADIKFFNTEYNVEEQVKIIQMQRDAILVAQNEYTISAKTTELNFEVNTNVDFKVTTSASWIKERKFSSRSLEIVPVRFSIDENVFLQAREGYIYITSNEVQQTIKIIQNGRIDYGKFSITHTNNLFQIPFLTGNNLIGYIDWGDGETETFQNGIIHSYSNNSLYTTTTECWGAEEIKIEGIQGIVEINLSDF